jgi:putative endonuclease
MKKGAYYTYIVLCSNGTYYTGYTNNVSSRLKQHNSGNGAKYLRGRGPVKLVYAKKYAYSKNALHAERNLKKLTRTQKEDLIRAYAIETAELCNKLGL